MVAALNEDVLVLNRSWLPLNTICASRALSDAFCDRVQIVDPTDYSLHDIDSWLRLPVPEGKPAIHAATQLVRVPEIVRNAHKGYHQRKVKWSRRNLWLRDAWRCQYCSRRPEDDEITVDHVIPRSRSDLLPPGVMMSSFENCVLCCVKCNKRKDNRTLKEAGMRLQRLIERNGAVVVEYYDRPTAPKWSPFFAMKRKRKPPESWGPFVESVVNDLYWNSSLDTD